MKIIIKKEQLVHSRDKAHLEACIKYPARVVESKKRKPEKHKKNLKVEYNI